MKGGCIPLNIMLATSNILGVNHNEKKDIFNNKWITNIVIHFFLSFYAKQ